MGFFPRDVSGGGGGGFTLSRFSDSKKYQFFTVDNLLLARA